MKAWSEAGNADGITMLADGKGIFTKALGFEMDGTGYGIGSRAQRFALYAENGVVKSIGVESVTGITNFLENDGTLEPAQRIAGYAESRTTKLYDCRGQKFYSKIWRGFAIKAAIGAYAIGSLG